MAERKRLPDTRESITQKLHIRYVDEDKRPHDVKIYMQVGLYPDTRMPGEIFLKADKMGSTISGLLDALSMSISVALQAGVPLEWFVEKMKNLQFSPAGSTNIPGIRKATSIVDGLARWLEIKFLSSKETTP
jgi:ribonucleoside-diphosphate reductase alpha chain